MSENARPRRRRRAAREPIVTTPWGERWLQSVDAAIGVGRLGRGREYARAGRVDELTIEPGHISAIVQGSRPTPYRVDIRLPAFEASTWTRAIAHMGGRASTAAALVAGAMPEAAEPALAAAGASLFPDASERLAAACTCPDWDRPCKHAAAVLYAVAARLDRDPFVLFAVRGKSREELTRELRSARRDAAARAGLAAVATAEPSGPTLGDALVESLASFWTLGPIGRTPEPTDEGDGAAMRRLGLPPRALGGVELKMELVLAYRVMADRARRLLEGS